MEMVRLRLVFDKALSISQNTEGLKRCWILLKPQLKTISDLSSYLLRSFDLQNACPSGLVLSMEGFALPPFESTSIFKDKDIIRVKKKVETCTEIVKVDDGLDSLEVVEIVEKPPEPVGMNLLANEEFEKESGGYESEAEEDAPQQMEVVLRVENSTPEVKTVSKKRKASKELRSSKSKKKKNKSASTEKCKVVPEDVKNNVPAVQNGTLISANKSSQPQENGNGNEDASYTPSGTKKSPSRSARRKKAKRQWLRERLKAEKEEKQLLENANRQSSGKDNHKALEEPSGEGTYKVSEEMRVKEENNPKEDHQQPDQDSDVDDDVVPIVIRPGHIRFAPLNKVGTDQTVQQYQIPVGTFQWNGTTSKKKGQKWGKEKVASSKRNDYNRFSQECSRPLTIKEKIPECDPINKTLTIKEKMPVCDPINFDKLPPYTSLPKEGDVIAYRLIELSASWTPELSSYRVGKISQYDLESNIVMLLPVPEYPPIPEDKVDHETSNFLQGTSTYREDGSLEIKFSSLIDVRLVNHGNQNSAKPIASRDDNEVYTKNQDNGIGFIPNNSNEARSPIQENGEVHAWDEIKQALNTKKAELTQEDNWGKAERAQLTREDNWSKAESSGRKPWSYKALRGSALGPTMALLRAQNEL